MKQLLRSIQPNTAKVLCQTLAEFSWFYNHVRVDRNLKGLTPMEAWAGHTLADVQEVHARGTGRWVQACDGRWTGFHVRC